MAPSDPEPVSTRAVVTFNKISTIMKTSLNLLLIILMVSCNNPPEKEVTKNSPDSTNKNIAPKRSMKGFDLYAWEKDGNIYFTLLPGTNREKTAGEIYNMNYAVEGMTAIENKINEIDSGEYIFLKPVQTDTVDLKPLIEFMKRKNLEVTIIPERKVAPIDRK
jgi:hypothetical protein